MDASTKPILAKPPRPVLAASAIVLVIAAATILTALGFEHIGGYAPCPLCLEERYAYYFAVPVAALAVLLARREQIGIRPHPSARYRARLPRQCRTCRLSCRRRVEMVAGPDRMHRRLRPQWGEHGVVDTPVIRCDEASFRFLGLSFAGWDAVVSAFLACCAFAGAAQRR